MQVNLSTNWWTAILPIALTSPPAFAQSAASPAAADDEIIVTAPPTEQRADRRIYIVKDNAQAQTETGLQLLRHVPTVTIDAEDQVQLLGDPKVKVLIDGHPANDSSRDEETSDAWYRRVIKTEIVPLLREYWFDAPSSVETWAQRLLG